MNEFYKIDRDVTLSEKIDDDTVVINLSTGCYYNFNATASYIWELACCGLSKDEINSQYTAAFHLSTKKAASDVDLVINTMVSDSLADTTDEKPVTCELPTDIAAYIVPAIEKFDDMQEMLLLDPIHEVTEKGWPYKNNEQ